MSEAVKLYGINRLRETLVVAESTRRSMQGNKCQDTRPERALRKALWALGHRGYRKNVRRLPGTPDLVYGRFKVAVFVHGCFWHGHGCSRSRTPKTNSSFWKEKVRRNHDRFERQTTELKGLGFRVILIWECEICSELDEAVSKISRELTMVAT